MRIPVVTSLAIDSFSGGVVQVARSSTTNAVFGRKPDGTVYATQRPSINIFEDASATVADVKGRGIYYWNAVGALYFVNDDTVYKGNYSAPITGSITSGHEKVYFFEIGSYLVIIDPQGNKGYYISSSTSTTLTEITDVDFPPKQTPALQLARGGAVLNGRLYVHCTNGEIWESDVEDPTAWGSLSFRTAELEPDDGVLMLKHAGHVCAIGTRTIEYFYDNSNPAGSSLNPRTDIDHAIGAIDFDTVWSDGKVTFFCSLNPSGDINVSMMSGFEIQKISSTDIDTFLTSSVITDSISLSGSGFTAGGRAFYVLTTWYESGGINSLNTLVYDVSSGTWGFWELMHTGIDDFPVVDWTQSTSTRAGNGILANGDIITVVDDKNPQDTTEAQVYVLTDYVVSGYISDTSGNGEAIEMQIITGPNDFGMRDYKHADNLRVLAVPTTASQNVTVQWSDQSNNNYNAGRTLDMSNADNKLTRLGRFRMRNHKLTFSGTEQVEIEGIEVDIDG